MKKLMIFFLTLSIFLFNSTISGFQFVESQDQYNIETQLITLQDNTYSSLVTSLTLAQRKGWIVDWNWFPKTNILQITGDTTSVKDLFASHSVHIIPDLTVKADPIIPQGKSSTLPPKDWNLKDLEVAKLWAKGYTGKGVKIGILDTGCDGTHVQLKGKIRNFASIGRNGVAEISDTAFDTDNHGTHVSGIAAGGSTTNPLGVSPESDLLVGVVIPGGSGSFSQIIGGIEWAMDPDLDPQTDDAPTVINMSLGMPGFVDFWSPIFEKALDHNILIVSSSGNEGNGVSNSPGNHPYVLGIGSYNVEKKPSSFSAGDSDINWDGEYLQTNPYIKPDLSAPGSAIYSSVPGNMYAYFDGTSMSSPHVAGAAAILKQAYPSATAWDLRNMLIWGATDLGTPGWDTRYGNGILAIENSISLLLSSPSIHGTIDHYRAETHLWIPEINSGIYVKPDGSFTGKLIAGSYTIELRKGKEILFSQPLVVKEQSITLSISMPEYKRIQCEGVVLNNSGKPLSRAKITYLDSVYYTDSQGHFSFFAQQGDSLIIRHTGYQEQRVRVNGNNPWLNLRLEKAPLLLIEGFSPYSTLVNPPRQALPYYQETLHNLHKKYALLKCSEETVSFEDLEGFDQVILFYANGGLQEAETKAAEHYLQNGGKLLIAGRMVLLMEEFFRQDFLLDYLKIYSKNMIAFPSVEGIGENYSRTRFPLSGSGGANNQETCDVILPLPESKSIPILRYTATGEGKFAGVVSNNGLYKLGFLGFGIEGIGLQESRDQLLGTILTWMEQGGEVTLQLPPGEKYIHAQSAHDNFTTVTEETFLSFSNLFSEDYTFTIEQYKKVPVVINCDLREENKYKATIYFTPSPEQEIQIQPTNCSLSEAYLILYYRDQLISTEKINPAMPITKNLPFGEFLFCISAKGYKNQYYKLLIKTIAPDPIVAKMEMQKLTLHVLMVDDTPTGWAMLDRYLQIGMYTSRWMESTNIPFQYWSVEDRGFPAFQDLYPYEIVIDVAGRNVAALYAENRQSILGEYLQNGGKIAVLENSTHTVLENSAWMAEYFGVEVKNANIREKTVAGVSNSVTQSMYFDLFNPVEQDGLYITFPEFNPVKPQTKPLLQYASEKLCASYYDTGTFQTILIPFGLDNINMSDTRISLLQMIVKLLETGEYSRE